MCVSLSICFYAPLCLSLCIRVLHSHASTGANTSTRAHIFRLWWFKLPCNCNQTNWGYLEFPVRFFWILPNMDRKPQLSFSEVPTECFNSLFEYELLLDDMSWVTIIRVWLLASLVLWICCFFLVPYNMSVLFLWRLHIYTYTH